jgi:hypothetical protein
VQLRTDHPPSEVETKDSAFAAYPPFQIVDQTRPLNHKNDDFQGELMGLQEENWDDRFKSFQCVRVGSASTKDEKNSKLLNTN